MENLEVSAADLHRAYRDVFSSQSGRIILADLVRHFGFTSRSTIPHGADPHMAFFNEGSRQVVVYIEKVLITDPQTFNPEEPEYDGGDNDDIGGTD